MKQFYILLSMLFVSLTAFAEVDEYELINYQPEGEVKYYERSGVSYFENDQYKAEKGTQDGETLTMVYDADGKTVYLKDPVSMYKQDTWVRGTIEDNQIIVPLGQNLKYQGLLNDTYMKLGIFDVYDYTAYGAGIVAILNQDVTEVTYTINGNTITLEGTDDYRMLGVYWGDDLEWDHYGDSQSVYTLLQDEDLEPIPVDPLVPVFFPPEGQFKPEIDFRIYFQDIYDQPTLSENYTFTFFLKETGKEPYQYLFDSELYGFDDDMMYFPLDFEDHGVPPHFGYNPYGDVFWFTFEDFTDEWEEVGVQLVYTVGGNEYRSNIVYVAVPGSEPGDEDSINQLNTAKDAPIEYFDMLGRHIDKPQSGLYIERQAGRVKKVLR